VVIIGFSSDHAWQNPSVAVNWAQDISELDLRAPSLTRAGQIFFRRDPMSTQAWLDSSNLPAEMRQAILKPMR